jgi:RecA/RadA recombinase
MKVSTGCKALDIILDGGISIYTLTNIFGESASGKTQFCFQLCINFAEADVEIFFIDALNNFRPERVLEMKHCNDIEKAILDKIYISRPLGIMDAINSIEKVDEMNNPRLIIIDDISELLINTDSKKITKNLIMFVRKLLLKAIKYDLAIVITNRVGFNGYQKFDNIINRYVHYKIKFSKIDNLFAAEMLYPNDATAYFGISRKGLEDIYL